jgi:hypothetical protein
MVKGIGFCILYSVFCLPYTSCLIPHALHLLPNTYIIVDFLNSMFSLFTEAGILSLT